MEAEAEKVLKAILLKDPNDLTDHDKAFLKARWSYVGKNSRAKFADVLNMKSAKAEKPKEEKVEKQEAEDENENEETGNANDETDDTVED